MTRRRKGEVAEQAEDDEETAAGGSDVPRHPPFLLVLHQFCDTLDALRDLLGGIAPHVAALDTKRLSGAELAAIQGLTPEKQAQLAHWLDSLPSDKADEGAEEAQDSGATGAPETRSPTRGNGEPRRDPDETVTAVSADSDQEADDSGASAPDERHLTDEDVATLDGIFGHNQHPTFYRFQMKLARARWVPGRQALLNASLLTMAVGAFEVLVGGIRTQHHVLHPSTLDADKEFTLSDLRRFDSVADAEDEAIARRVDDLLRKDLDAWLQWFDQNTGLTSRSYAIDYDTLWEAFQRRHVIVHNAGRVSRTYLTRTPFLEHPPELNAPLEVDTEYLERAFDELEALGVLLAVGAWAKWDPDDEEVAIFQLYERMYELLLAGRWRVTRKLAEIGQKVQSADESMRLVFRCNGWLCDKRLDEFSDSKADVEDWDTSAFDTRFRLARSVLLEEMDEAFSLAESAVKTGDLGEEALLEWPLLEEMRADERFEHLLKQTRPDGPSGHLLKGTSPSGSDDDAEHGDGSDSA